MHKNRYISIESPIEQNRRHVLVLEKLLKGEGLLNIVSSLAKVISPDTLLELAKTLVTYHKPVDIDYYAKFALTPMVEALPTPATPQAESEKAPEKSASTYFCCQCKCTISPKVAIFCFQHKERFGGKAYCFDCQKAF